MCGICGCEEGPHEHQPAGAREQGHHTHDHAHDEPERVRLETSVLAKNDGFAAYNRGFFAGRKIFAANLLSSPGSGKTTLLERLIRDASLGAPVSVIEGDLATDRDAARIRGAGAPVIQINTGGLCHLDAHAVGHALEDLAPPASSIVFIENVGNLVCPALFDLGENERIVLWSVTEGEDKPVKYPHMFASASAVVLTKVDLLPHLSFDLEAALSFARTVSPKADTFLVSATTGEGMPALAGWIKRRAEGAIR